MRSNKSKIPCDNIRGHFLHTRHVDCKIESIEKRLDSSTFKVLNNNKKLEYTQVGEVILSTASPVVIDDFNSIKNLGRFILESDNETVAGGII